MNNKVLKEKSFNLAGDIIDICDELVALKRYSIADQLIRSGTAVGAIIRESVFAESIRDFIHKLSLAMKEAEESKYWLELIKHKNILEINNKLFEDIEHIQKVISILLKSSRNKLNKPNSNF